MHAPSSSSTITATTNVAAAAAAVLVMVAVGVLWKLKTMTTQLFIFHDDIRKCRKPYKEKTAAVVAAVKVWTDGFDAAASETKTNKKVKYKN